MDIDMPELETLLSSIRRGKHVFVHGIGGTGKSYLLRELRDRVARVMLTATTGMAAMNIGGSTIHSFCGIGWARDSPRAIYQAMHPARRNALSANLARFDVIAIDEISMFQGEVLDKLSAVMSMLTQCQLPFGGKQIVFTGDVLQLPPVDDAPIVDYFFKSKVWKRLFERDEIDCIHLCVPYRYSDLEWFGTLSRIRRGTFRTSDRLMLESRIDTATTVTPRIYALRKHVSRYNLIKLRELQAPQYVYIAADFMMQGDHGAVPLADAIRNVKRIAGIRAALEKNVKDRVVFKVGARVMLKVNMSVDLVNGLQGVITAIAVNDQSIAVSFDNGVNASIGLYDHVYSESKFVRYVRKQYPLILSWACTVHSVQGCSLDSAAIDIGSNIFTYAQTYVALSRVRSIDGLHLIGCDLDKCLVNKDALQYDSFIDRKSDPERFDRREWSNQIADVHHQLVHSPYGMFGYVDTACSECCGGMAGVQFIESLQNA